MRKKFPVFNCIYGNFWTGKPLWNAAPAIHKTIFCLPTDIYNLDTESGNDRMRADDGLAAVEKLLAQI